MPLGWRAPLFPAFSSPAASPSAPTTTAPATPRPPAYKETGATTVVVPPPNPQGGAWQPANPSDGMLKGKWWEIYQDPQLNQLEERIDTNNVQLRQAMETYLAARRPGAGRARQSLSHAFGRPLDQPRSRFGQPAAGRHPGSANHLRRLRHRRPGQLGAGLLGPHPPHRGAGPRQRSGQRRRRGQRGSHAPCRDGHRLLRPARARFRRSSC